MRKIILLLCILMIGSAATVLGTDKIFRTRTISNCSDIAAVKYKGHFIGKPSHLVPNNKLVIDGVLQFDEALHTRLDLAIDAFRCSPVERKDCDTYPRFVVPGFCEKLTATGSFYDGFLKAVSPRLMCPLKKGTYTLANATLDLDIVKAMPLQGFKWRAQIRLIDGKSNEADFCADVVLDIEDVKRKRRRKPGA